MPLRVFFLILSFLICSLLGTAMALFARRLTRRRAATLEKRLGLGDEAPDPDLVRISLEYDTSQGWAAALDRRLARFMQQAGIALAPDAAFLVAVAVGLTLCGTILLWRDNFLEAAVALVAGFLAVFGYYGYCRAWRTNRIREQLPDVMDLMARAVRAGESLDQAIHLIGETVAKPLGPEFHRCARQLEMGLSIDATMQALTRRAPIAEIRILTSTLIVQRRAGGSLPATLERLSMVIRDRINYHRQFKAATGAGRVSTILIGSAGPLIGVYMVIWQHQYFQKFLTGTPGHLMLAAALVLQVVGYTWIYNLLKSDY